MIMLDNSQSIEGVNNSDQLHVLPAHIPFENSAVSLKMEDIDFYKLSMIAGGGNDTTTDQKVDLNHESIKEVVQ